MHGVPAVPVRRALDQRDHPDPVRAPGRDPRLHRGADVRAVHVDGPGAASGRPVADHRDRVAEAVQRRPERRHPVLVGAVEQVHDLVRGLGGGPGTALLGGPLRGRHGHELRGRRRLPVGDQRRQRVEDDAEPQPAGVDHPGPGQLGQLPRGVAHRGGRGTGGGHRDLVEPVGTGRARGRRRGGEHGQHGALARPGHGLGGEPRRAGERVDQHPATTLPARPRGRRHRLGDAPQHLGEDHPGVAARAAEGTAGECLGGRDRATRVRAGGAADEGVGPHRGRRRPHREQQVGAGVPVGDGEDVDPVDVRAVPLQGGRGGVGPALEQHGVEGRGHGVEPIVGSQARRAATARPGAAGPPG